MGDFIPRADCGTRPSAPAGTFRSGWRFGNRSLDAEFRFCFRVGESGRRLDAAMVLAEAMCGFTKCKPGGVSSSAPERLAGPPPPLHT
jgi:hypothetical protein